MKRMKRIFYVLNRRQRRRTSVMFYVCYNIGFFYRMEQGGGSSCRPALCYAALLAALGACPYKARNSSGVSNRAARCSASWLILWRSLTSSGVRYPRCCAASIAFARAMRGRTRRPTAASTYSRASSAAVWSLASVRRATSSAAALSMSSVSGLPSPRLGMPPAYPFKFWLHQGFTRLISSAGRPLRDKALKTLTCSLINR